MRWAAITVACCAVVTAIGALSAGSVPRGGCTRDVICVTRVVTAHFRDTPPPRSRGPLPPAGIAFADGDHGFLGSTDGAIQTTSDAGSTWHTVWQRPATSVSWIGLAGDGTVVAAGDRGRDHVVVSTSDRGRTWTVVRAAVPRSHAVFFRWNNLRFQFVDSRVGFGWPNPYGPGDSSPVIRTTDGGVHWTALRMPFGASSVHFVSERDGYATGSPPDRRRCYSQVFRTSDGGETWQPVPGTCRGYELWGIDTPDAEHVYVGGGSGYWEADKAFQAVIASADGGLTWHQLYDASTGSAQLPIVDIHFADADHGWAETGSCKGGQNGPCGGEVLTTSDGGRSWRETGHHGVVLTTAGADRAWTCCERSGVVWRTVDRGRTWEPLARPETVAPQALDAGWPWITAGTAIGQLLSRDGGRTWAPFGSPSAEPAQSVPPLIRPGLIVVVDRGIRVSHDGGRTWIRRRPFGASDEIDSVAFADDRHGLAACSYCVPLGALMARTDDGGRTWRRVPDAPTPDLLGIAEAHGIAVMAVQWNSLAISHDDGKTWMVQTLRSRDLCGNPAAAAPGRAWFVCEHSVGDGSVFYLLASRDAGATWTRIDLRRASFSALAASPDGRGPLLAVGERWTSSAVQTVWKSPDGGRTWAEAWIPAG